MNDIFNKLAAAEEKFFNAEFLSPVLRGQPVRVRIAGITVELRVQPRNFEGWGIFRANDQKTARFVREPNMTEKREYLDLYPRFAMIVCQRGERVLAILANKDARMEIKGQVPILLPEEVQFFDTIEVRFDGANFWFDGQAMHRSPRIAAAMREALTNEVEPKDLEVNGISKEERLAYMIAHLRDIESKKDREEERIKLALERGGAIYRSYVERAGTYTIEYEVDGARHRSTVDKDTLEVSSAGICLSGQDRRFDLQSLVGVMREAEDTGRMHRW
jgi:hypothetical protein